VRQLDLGRRLGAVGLDVVLADVLARGAFCPKLPQSTPPRHSGSPGPTDVTRCANSPRKGACRRILDASLEIIDPLTLELWHSPSAREINVYALPGFPAL
jgi:hypothetical protein